MAERPTPNGKPRAPRGQAGSSTSAESARERIRAAAQRLAAEEAARSAPTRRRAATPPAAPAPPADQPVAPPPPASPAPPPPAHQQAPPAHQEAPTWGAAAPASSPTAPTAPQPSPPPPAPYREERGKRWGLLALLAGLGLVIAAGIVVLVMALTGGDGKSEPLANPEAAIANVFRSVPGYTVEEAPPEVAEEMVAGLNDIPQVAGAFTAAETAILSENGERVAVAIVFALDESFTSRSDAEEEFIEGATADSDDNEEITVSGDPAVYFEDPVEEVQGVIVYRAGIVVAVVSPLGDTERSEVEDIAADLLDNID